jgi:hypothetical protein
LIASVNGLCVAEIPELPYDGNMWGAVCLRSPKQKVRASELGFQQHFDFCTLQLRCSISSAKGVAGNYHIGHSGGLVQSSIVANFADSYPEASAADEISRLMIKTCRFDIYDLIVSPMKLMHEDAPICNLKLHQGVAAACFTAFLSAAADGVI